MAVQQTRIDGLDHAIKQFRRAPVVARKYIGEAVRVTEVTAAQNVRRAAPRDTGALAHAIGSATTGLNARIFIEPGMIYGQFPSVYWRFVEFGTKNMPAQPFIRTTSENEQKPFIGRIEQAGAKLERELTI